VREVCLVVITEEWQTNEGLQHIGHSPSWGLLHAVETSIGEVRLLIIYKMSLSSLTSPMLSFFPRRFGFLWGGCLSRLHTIRQTEVIAKDQKIVLTLWKWRGFEETDWGSSCWFLRLLSLAGGWDVKLSNFYITSLHWEVDTRQQGQQGWEQGWWADGDVFQPHAWPLALGLHIWPESNWCCKGYHMHQILYKPTHVYYLLPLCEINKLKISRRPYLLRFFSLISYLTDLRCLFSISDKWIKR